MSSKLPPVYQPVVIGDFIRSVHTHDGVHHITWHSLSVVQKIYADDRDIVFFVDEGDDAVPYRAARLMDHAAAKRTLFDLLQTMAGEDKGKKDG